jgi:hypothetical protein
VDFASPGVPLEPGPAQRTPWSPPILPSDRFLRVDEDAPDPRYACALAPSPGLAAAAARRAGAPVERGDGCVRVLGATVRRAGDTLTCDCPMGGEPACLHRLLADAWARGERVGAGNDLAPAALLDAAPDTAAALEGRARAGEKLPPEDEARFAPILARAETLIAEILTFGLQRTTRATLERIDALSTLARTAGVREGAPRHAGLGRLLRTVARLRRALAELQDRLVTTTERDVVRELAVLHDLVRALRANTGALPLSSYAGAVQQEYVEVPAIDGQGLGFEAWVTPAGFAGVTAYVADLRTGRVLTRTGTLDAGLAAQAAARGWGSASWASELAGKPAFASGPITFLDLARGRFRLVGALVAPDSGRLSGSGKTQLAARPRIAMDDPRLRPSTLLDAGDAVRIARRLGFDPLGRPPPSPPVALLPVGRVTPSRFDRVAQTLRFEIVSPGGGRIACALTYREERALWIDNLEALCRAAPPPRFLFARLSLDGGGLTAEPLAATFDEGEPRQLTYRPLARAAC